MENIIEEIVTEEIVTEDVEENTDVNTLESDSECESEETSETIRKIEYSRILDTFSENHKEFHCGGFWKDRDGNVVQFRNFSLNPSATLVYVNCTDVTTGAKITTLYTDFEAWFVDGQHASGYVPCQDKDRLLLCEHEDNCYWLAMFFFGLFLMGLVASIQIQTV
jgi:hypothetical protein